MIAAQPVDEQKREAGAVLLVIHRKPGASVNGMFPLYTGAPPTEQA